MGRLLIGSLLAVVCSTTGSTGTPDATPAAPPTSAVASAPREPAPAPVDDAPEPTIAASDACPDGPETVNGFEDGDGCPDQLPPDLAAITGIVEGITFELDKDIIVLGSRPALDRLVAVLTRYPQVEIEIAVHSDDTSNNYGRCLTCRRADAIRNYLIAHGIEPARLLARGYGSSRPIASNRTAEGRRRNRRIELSLKGAPAGTTTAATAATTAQCTDRRSLRRADGSAQSCYPYVCRAGACLTRCDAITDCAGAHTPAEFPAQGWPLECMPSGECTPMPPDKVR